MELTILPQMTIQLKLASRHARDLYDYVKMTTQHSQNNALHSKNGEKTDCCYLIYKTLLYTISSASLVYCILPVYYFLTQQKICLFVKSYTGLKWENFIIASNCTQGRIYHTALSLCSGPLAPRSVAPSLGC